MPLTYKKSYFSFRIAQKTYALLYEADESVSPKCQSTHSFIEGAEYEEIDFPDRRGRAFAGGL
jgi:hypothetical protein